MLNDEHEKYVKKIHRQNKSSFSIVSESTASTLKEIDPVDNESLPETLTSIINPDSCLTSSGQVIEKPLESISISPSSVNHIDAINNTIDKYSRRCFVSTILKYNERYRLSMVRQNEQIKVILHCQCGTKVSVYRRDESSPFILSNYYAHLSESTCSMMRQILKHDETINFNTSDSICNGAKPIVDSTV